MCYYLYGGINFGVNEEYLKKLNNLDFLPCLLKDFKENIQQCNWDYRITYGPCDCQTAIGRKNKNKKELKDYAKDIFELKKVRGIKHIYLSKCWTNNVIENEITVHIDDIDVIDFLANIRDDYLYKIQLFKKYY